MPGWGGLFKSPLRHKSRAGCRSLPLDAASYRRTTLDAVSPLGLRRGDLQVARPIRCDQFC
jgi:hypothetical protein